MQTRGEGVLQIRTSALFVPKNFGFFKIYGVPARTRGLSLRIKVELTINLNLESMLTFWG